MSLCYIDFGSLEVGELSWMQILHNDVASLGTCLFSPVAVFVEMVYIDDVPF